MKMLHEHADLFFHMWWYGKATYFPLVIKQKHLLGWHIHTGHALTGKEKEPQVFWNTHKMQVITYQDINMIHWKDREHVDEAPCIKK